MQSDVVSMWMSIISCLATLYQAVNPQRTEILNEIRIEIAEESQADIEQVIESKVSERFEPLDASEIRTDLALIGSVFLTAKVESFRYVEILRNLLDGLRGFCERTNLFVLRGVQFKGDYFLRLPKTAAAICNAETKAEWVDDNREDASKPQTTKVELYLIRNSIRRNLPHDFPQESLLPLFGFADFSYEVYLSVGGTYGNTGAAMFYVFPGSEAHWLAYISDKQSNIRVSYQRMLRSRDTKAIVDAIRDDWVTYMNDISEDQEFSNSALKESVDSLTARLTATNDITDEG